MTRNLPTDDAYAPRPVRLPRGISCPVCERTAGNLVEHHDHFGDLCQRLLYQATGRLEWYFEQNPWATFPKVFICRKCNAIDVWAKRSVPKLPLWVSFSPVELCSLVDRDDAAITRLCTEIWPFQREQYKRKLRQLIELGVIKEMIAREWYDRSQQSYSGAGENRRVMLEYLAAAPTEVKELCQQPGNEKILAEWIIIRRLQWPWYPPALHFIFWYHKKHGDPSCRNNQFGITEGRFLAWWRELVAGNPAGAQYIRYALYWKDKQPIRTNETITIASKGPPPE
jgi:hypothetical protein